MKWFTQSDVGRLLIAAGAVLFSLITALAAQDSAEWVARQVRDRNTGRDSRAELRMRLYDRQGRVRERAMTLLSLRGANGAGDRTLIRDFSTILQAGEQARDVARRFGNLRPVVRFRCILRTL